MDFKSDKQGDVTVLEIRGDLTVQCAHEFKEVLLRSLDGTKYIVLNLEQVAEIDLSCLQLLCSAHQTFMRSNKKVALSGLCSGTFQKTVADAGYSSRKGCIMDTDENCLFVTALHGVEELRS